MTPPLVRSLHPPSPPMHQALAAAGENFAVTVGFFLESLPGPLASFDLHFQLDLPQGRRTRHA